MERKKDMIRVKTILTIKISSIKEYKDFMAISNTIGFIWNSGHNTIECIPSGILNKLEKDESIFVLITGKKCTWGSSSQAYKTYNVKSFEKMVLYMAKQTSNYFDTKNNILYKKKKLANMTTLLDFSNAITFI